MTYRRFVYTDVPLLGCFVGDAKQFQSGQFPASRGAWLSTPNAGNVRFLALAAPGGLIVKTNAQKRTTKAQSPAEAGMVCAVAVNS
jgi:hypothetical protein